MTGTVWALMGDVLAGVVLVVVMVAVARHQLARLRPLAPAQGEDGREDDNRDPSQVRVGAEGASDASAELDLSDVSVVVPARNEALSLPALLASLAPVRTSLHDLVVVDDGSTDGTADLAAAGSATVVRASEPPAGWVGKSWACHLGVQETSGRLLVFLDADTALSPDALPSLLALHDRKGGLVSVQPHHRPVRAHEQLSAYFNAVSLMGTGLFAPRRPSRPMAFGPCLVTTRADYVAAGGHEGVRCEILDDASLAAAYDRAGMPVSCVVGGAAVAMRMYPGGARQLVEGWTKNFASGATQADLRSSVLAALWVAAHCAVAGGVVSALAALATTGGAARSWLSLVVWLLAWAATAVHLRGLLGRIGTFRWWAWVLFPVPLAFFALVFLRSLVLTHLLGRVTWRGRDVAVGARLRSE